MKQLAIITASILYSTALWAGPAAWYKWRSAMVDYDVCSQISPGNSWTIVKGPFEDSGCRKQLQK